MIASKRCTLSSSAQQTECCPFRSEALVDLMRRWPYVVMRVHTRPSAAAGGPRAVLDQRDGVDPLCPVPHRAEADPPEPIALCAEAGPCRIFREGAFRPEPDDPSCAGLTILEALAHEGSVMTRLFTNTAVSNLLFVRTVGVNLLFTGAPS